MKYRLVLRKNNRKNLPVKIGNITLSEERFLVIAGPCAVENRRQAFQTASAMKAAGLHFFRGGAFKPRTSPYSFQGLGEEGLEILAEVKKKFGLFIVTEAVDHENFDLVEQVADITQIGARNMQNFSLLKRAGRSKKPVLLKRSHAATLDEFLSAAEYIMAAGNPRVILCERGIRAVGAAGRNVLDFTAISELKKITHLPVIVDPSHASGCRDAVLPLARAAVVTSADGVLVEFHPSPDSALSDGPQSLPLSSLKKFHGEIASLAKLFDKKIV